MRRKRRRFSPIEGSEFKQARLIAGFKRQEVAKLLKVTVRTVSNWERGAVGVPYSAFKLLRILSGYELPGEAWAGWCIRGGALWSPEGKSFQASEFAWWSLTCSMARRWREAYEARQAWARGVSPPPIQDALPALPGLFPIDGVMPWAVGCFWRPSIPLGSGVLRGFLPSPLLSGGVSASALNHPAGASGESAPPAEVTVLSNTVTLSHG